MQQLQARIAVRTRANSTVGISSEIQNWLHEIGAKFGVLTVFIMHTSASLMIQENADPDVQADLLDALSIIAPETDSYRHSTEGPDDMPAHIKSALTSTSLTIPVEAGRMTLGTWQGIYLVEHRAMAHDRQIVLHYSGDLD